jgi:hypothetical protein
MPESEKSALVEALRTQGAWVEETLRALTDEQLALGRYENGWSGREIVAHVAAIEWTYPRLIDRARNAAGADADAGDQGGGAPRGGMDGYNRRQVERRAATPVEELIDEFRRNREALLLAIEEADDALFDVAIQSAGGREGTLAQVLREVAIEHVEGHVHDVVGRDPAGR